MSSSIIGLYKYHLLLVACEHYSYNYTHHVSRDVHVWVIISQPQCALCIVPAILCILYMSILDCVLCHNDSETATTITLNMS